MRYLVFTGQRERQREMTELSIAATARGFEIHKPGCKDLNKFRSSDIDTFEFSDLEDIAWFLFDGQMQDAEDEGRVHVYIQEAAEGMKPCAKGLVS